MPKVEENQELVLQDVRVMIHQLKMDGFAGIEPEAIDQIKFRIKGLPEPEELNSMTGDVLSLKRMAKEIGEIMHLLEIYGKKGPEFKTRYESLKGMPPRYKVLEWRAANMNTDFVRQVIKLSAKVDFEGHPKVAQTLNVLAKKALNFEDIQEDTDKAVKALSDIHMGKEAQGVKDFFSKMVGRDPGNIATKNREAINRATYNALTYIKRLMDADDFDTGKIRQLIGKIQDTNVKAQLSTYVEQIDQTERNFFNMIEKMSHLAGTLLKQYDEGTGTFGASATPEAPVAPAPEQPEAVPEAAAAAAVTLPQGAPKPTSGQEAANFAQFVATKGRVFTMASRNLRSKTIRVASQELQDWVNANLGNTAVLEQALRYYQSKAGNVTTPSAGASFDINNSGIGHAKPPVASLAGTLLKQKKSEWSEWFQDLRSGGKTDNEMRAWVNKQEGSGPEDTKARKNYLEQWLTANPAPVSLFDASSVSRPLPTKAYSQYAPEMRVENVNTNGIGTVKQVLSNGNIQVAWDGGGTIAVTPKEIKPAPDAQPATAPATAPAPAPAVQPATAQFKKSIYTKRDKGIRMIRIV